MKKCPKCGYERQPKDDKFYSSLECPKCQVIYEKYKTNSFKKQPEETKKVNPPQNNIHSTSKEETNLAKCQICKKEISKNANPCPYCGEPLPLIDKAKQKKLTKEIKKTCYGCLTIIAILFFGFIVTILINTPKNNESAREAVNNSAFDGSVYQVKNYLKKNLKDPDSFQSMEWSKVVKRDDGSYMVRCKYRAKNSFNGYVISNQIFILDSKGNVINVYDYN